MAKHKSYGSVENNLEEGSSKEEGRSSSDTMRSQVRGGDSLLSADGRRKEDVEMHPLADEPAVEDESDSDESAQAGVKRAEAISTTWTKLSLYAAYLGCVTSDPLGCHVRTR